MLVLGIETATPQTSVAIGSEQGVVASALVSRAALDGPQNKSGARYNEWLMPAIRFCLEGAGIGFRNIGGVAVSLGPGLYTGMRVGVSRLPLRIQFTRQFAFGLRTLGEIQDLQLLPLVGFVPARR